MSIVRLAVRADETRELADTVDVLGRIEEIVGKALAAGEPALPRNLVAKVSVLLREQLADQAERARVVTQAAETFGKRYAVQLQAALERAGADAPAPPPPPPAIARPASPATRAPSAPKPRPAPRGLVTRHLDSANRQLSRVPEGLRVFYQGTAATIEPPGMVLDNGRSFGAPTPAAMYVDRGEHANGWAVWKLADGRSLQDCWDSGDWPEPEQPDV